MDRRVGAGRNRRVQPRVERIIADHPLAEEEGVARPVEDLRACSRRSGSARLRSGPVMWKTPSQGDIAVGKGRVPPLPP